MHHDDSGASGPFMNFWISAGSVYQADAQHDRTQCRRARHCPHDALAQAPTGCMPCIKWDWGLGLLGYISAAPRSLHHGGVNIAFLDGHVDFLSDDVDPFTMAYLVGIEDEKVGIMPRMNEPLEPREPIEPVAHLERPSRHRRFGSVRCLLRLARLHRRAPRPGLRIRRKSIRPLRRTFTACRTNTPAPPAPTRRTRFALSSKKARNGTSTFERRTRIGHRPAEAAHLILRIGACVMVLVGAAGSSIATECTTVERPPLKIPVGGVSDADCGFIPKPNRRQRRLPQPSGPCFQWRKTTAKNIFYCGPQSLHLFCYAVGWDSGHVQ